MLEVDRAMQIRTALGRGGESERRMSSANLKQCRKYRSRDSIYPTRRMLRKIENTTMKTQLKSGLLLLEKHTVDINEKSRNQLAPCTANGTNEG